MLRAAVVPTAVVGSVRVAQAVSWRNGVGFGNNAGEFSQLAAEVGRWKAGRVRRSTGGRAIRVRARVAEERDLQGDSIAEDYYSILGLVGITNPFYAQLTVFKWLLRNPCRLVLVHPAAPEAYFSCRFFSKLFLQQWFRLSLIVLLFTLVLFSRVLFCCLLAPDNRLPTPLPTRSRRRTTRA